MYTMVWLFVEFCATAICIWRGTGPAVTKYDNPPIRNTATDTVKKRSTLLLSINKLEIWGIYNSITGYDPFIPFRYRNVESLAVLF
jgi:hypothetical protein